MLEWALIENIHREDLNPVERAQAYRQYIDRFSLTQADAAERLGQPRATVANYLRILDLDEHTQRLIADLALSFGHAKVLAGAGGPPERRAELARKAVREGLSVRELERLVADGDKGGPSSSGGRRTRPKDPHVSNVEQQLSRGLGMPVTIQPRRGGRSGRIVIRYASLDDFDRLVSALGLTLES